MSTQDIIILGAGVGGLVTALILADAGYDVCVLERDPDPPPPDDERSWMDWNRPGAPQLRQPHGLLGRTRSILATELPEVWSRIASVGIDLEMFAGAPDPGALVDDDRRFVVTTVRRTTAERVLADAADAHPRIDVRRGEVVTGLQMTPGADSRRAHVSGVLVDDRPLRSELVVDATGRRSPVGEWLEAAGVPVERSSESDGFTYFSRWFRYDDGLPDIGPGTFGGFGPGFIALVFPGDGNSAAIATVGTARDPLFRRLGDPDRFTRVLGSFPLLGPWVHPDAATPTTEVLPMGAIQNRHLRLRTDATPPVSGLVNTGDSALSTNPSLGRGIGLAADMAIRLRSALACGSTPAELADRWDDEQHRHHFPWLGDSIDSDAQLRATFDGWSRDRAPAPPPNPRRAALGKAAMVDMDCWRAWSTVNQLFATPEEAWYDDPELLEHAAEVVRDVPPPRPVLTRAEFEAAVT